MAKKKAAPITNLDRARLLKCPYVYNATKHSIAFTEEGKRRIWEGLLSGKSCVRVLLEDLGLPPVDHVYDCMRRSTSIGRGQNCQRSWGRNPSSFAGKR